MVSREEAPFMNPEQDYHKGWKSQKTRKPWSRSCIMIYSLGPSLSSIMAAGASITFWLTATAEYTGGWDSLSQNNAMTSHGLFKITRGSFASTQSFHDYVVIEGRSMDTVF
jgi:hypothetical protein